MPIQNLYGALVRLKNAVPLGTRMDITNLKTKAKAKGRVVWLGDRGLGGGIGVGIELATPEAAFWVGYESE